MQSGLFSYGVSGATSESRLKKVDCTILLPRIDNKLAGWVGKYLSVVGKLVFINAMLSSLPTYYMSIFILLNWVVGTDKLWSISFGRMLLRSKAFLAW